MFVVGITGALGEGPHSGLRRSCHRGITGLVNAVVDYIPRRCERTRSAHPSLVSEIICYVPKGTLNSTLTHSSTNRARRKTTALIEAHQYAGRRYIGFLVSDRYLY